MTDSSSIVEDETRASLYVARDICFALFLYKFAYSITPWAEGNFGGYVTEGWQKMLLKALMWCFYWWFQGLVGAGIFCLGTFFLHVAGSTKGGLIADL